MSEAQREVSNALLDDIFGDWVAAVAAARGKSKAEVLALLDDPKGIFDMAALSAGGWITGTKYLDEIQQARLNAARNHNHQSSPHHRLSLLSEPCLAIGGHRLLSLRGR